MVIADLDMALVAKRKRMMDSVGHYSRPELLSVLIDRSPQPHLRQKYADFPAPQPQSRIAHEPLTADRTSPQPEEAVPPLS
jgi:aliphatic nitrilase